MGRMTDDMTRLCDEIIAGREVRADFLVGVKDAVENLREVTVEMRADFRGAHKNMAADLRSSLEDSVDQIKRQVMELKKHNAGMRQAMRQSNRDMARYQRDERNAFVTDLAGSVTAMLDGFLDARANMAVEAQAQLGAFCEGLKRDASLLRKETEDLLTAIRSSQAETTRSSRAERISFLASQVAFVNQFMGQVAELMDNLRREQEDAATRGHGSRQRFVSELRTEVSSLQNRFARERRHTALEMMEQLVFFDEDIKAHVKELKAAVGLMRREFSDDLAGARAAWQGRKAAASPSTTTEPAPKDSSEQTSAPQPEEAEPETVAMEEEPPAQAPEEDVPAPDKKNTQAKQTHLEQLTVIKGIGPRIQGKLYLAGIDTYAKLAKSNPARLREILDQVARTANVESWIEQAKKLV